MDAESRGCKFVNLLVSKQRKRALPALLAVNFEQFQVVKYLFTEWQFVVAVAVAFSNKHKNLIRKEENF